MRSPSAKRMIYWIIMLPAVAAVVWFFWKQYGEVDKLMGPK